MLSNCTITTIDTAYVLLESLDELCIFTSHTISVQCMKVMLFGEQARHSLGVPNANFGGTYVTTFRSAGTV